MNITTLEDNGHNLIISICDNKVNYGTLIKSINFRIKSHREMIERQR